MIDHLEKLCQRAKRYLSEGQLVHARAVLDSMQVRAPGDVRGLLLEGDIAWFEGRIRVATRCALDAALAGCDDPGLLCEVSEALWRTGEIVALRECLGNPVLAQMRSGALLSQVADLRQRLKENQSALELIERARALGENDATTRFHYGVQLAFNGRLQEAEAELTAALAMDPANGRAAFTLARLREQSHDHNHLALIGEGLRVVTKGSREHAGLEFARFEELEDLGRFDEAWGALQRGNALMHERIRFNAADFRRHVDDVVSRFTSSAVQGASGVRAGPQPIFIVGMPRSGTTLVERILGNHSAVSQGGELEDFERQVNWVADHGNTRGDLFRQRMCDLDFKELGHRYLSQTQWRAQGRQFFTDKQPPNWLLLGLIIVALPHAKIVHLVRDPVDVCWSNWRTFFGDTCGYSYHMSTLVDYYDDYRRLMAHWHEQWPGRIFDLRYSDLVNDPEAATRSLFDFCGLAWEPECLDLSRNTAPVSTLSLAQVRGSIHSRGSGEWRPYRHHLEGLFRALGTSAVQRNVHAR